MTRSLVFVASLVLGALGVVLYVGEAHAGSAPRLLRHGVTDQCQLPVSQRTGGWFCPDGG